MRIASVAFLVASVSIIGSLAGAAQATTQPADHTPPSPIQAAAASPADMVVANPNGKATVIAVVDYQDYGLHMMRDQLSAFARENPDIKLVVKPWASGGPLSRFAAKAAYAAAKQGKLPQFHTAMISDLGPHTWYSLRNAAPAFGLDWKRFETDFADQALDQRVEADARTIAELKISSSPAFIAGGRVFRDPWNKINLAQVAQTARQEKGTDAAASVGE